MHKAVHSPHTLAASCTSFLAFTAALQELLTALRCLWKCGPHWLPFLCTGSLPTPIRWAREHITRHQRLPPYVTSLESLRASFTLVQLLVRSYIRTTKRSSSGVAFCKATSLGFSPSCLNTSVISLKLHQVSHAFLSLACKC